MADEAPEAARLLDPADVVELQLAARRVTIDDATVDYAIRLVLATRDPAEHGLPTLVGLLDYGASPRASLGLVRSARAMALLRGRERAVAQDVYDVAYDILNARLALSYRATAEGFTIDDVLVELLSTVPAPGSAVWGPPIRTDITGPAATPSMAPASPYATPAIVSTDGTVRYAGPAASAASPAVVPPRWLPPQPVRPHVTVAGSPPLAPTATPTPPTPWAGPTPPIVLPGDPPASR